MKYKGLKPIIIILLVLSVLAFLWNSIFLFLSGFIREHNAIKITDNNRTAVISLLKENVDCYEEVPNIEQAVKIEYLVLMHKDRITLYYSDETTYSFFIKDAYKNPFTLYIKNEGYNVYFKSSEFAADLVKAFISLALSIIFVIILAKERFKTK